MLRIIRGNGKMNKFMSNEKGDTNFVSIVLVGIAGTAFVALFGRSIVELITLIISSIF